MLTGDRQRDLFRNKSYVLPSIYSEHSRTFLIISPLEVSFPFYLKIKMLKADSLDFFLIKVISVVVIL